MTEQEANLTQQIEALRAEIDKQGEEIKKSFLLIAEAGRQIGTLIDGYQWLTSQLQDEQRSRQVLADRVLKLWHDR